MSPSVPDVWIRDFTQNTPAHRVADPTPDPERSEDAIHRIICPPGEVTGGQVISRKLAATLPALPCALCFPPPPAKKRRSGGEGRTA